MFGLLRFIYDIYVLGISNTFIWCCSTSEYLLPFFKSRIQARKHLDIGVGTGYYLAHSDLGFSSSTTAEGTDVADITLCDLSPDSLRTAAGNLRAAVPGIRVRMVLHDIEKPLPKSTPSSQESAEKNNAEEKHEVQEKFDSISLMYLLHCMPGPPSRKAAIFTHLKYNLNPDNGVLFGATVLNRGVSHNFFGRYLIDVYNRKGIFGNRDDDAEGFLVALRENFEDVRAEIRGRVLMFEARGPVGV
ncbi:hypothetical protein MMC28_007027 [Mycoblastus sanguinarius]|nr:hypothetical protein [Mycoblastus sanguinarius]